MGCSDFEYDVEKQLSKMGLTASNSSDGEWEVTAPFYRNDIMHQCDVAEDLLIAIGFNNIPEKEIGVVTEGKQFRLNNFC